MNESINILIVNQPIPPTSIWKKIINCPQILNWSTITTVDSPVSENADEDMNNASMKEIASAPCI
jgi:hypothetical protein